MDCRIDCREDSSVCVCVHVCACVRACVRACMCACVCVRVHACVVSQCLDVVQGAEGALSQALDLVVIQGQQGQVLQVLEGRGADAVDLVGVEQPEERRAEWGSAQPRTTFSTFCDTMHLCHVGMFNVRFFKINVHLKVRSS